MRSFSDVDRSTELIRRSRVNLAESDRYLETAVYLRALLHNLARSSPIAEMPDAPPTGFMDSD